VYRDRRFPVRDEAWVIPAVRRGARSSLNLGITVTPYLLHRYLECRTMSAWHASAASSLQDFRIT
jgi:hypothetical protein